VNDDDKWMQRALELARRAEEEGEVPVGALVVLDNEVVGEGWNRPIQSKDPSSHAEINAMRAAGLRLDNYRLPGTELYVSLEPCVMCAGAMVQARVARVIYGVSDPRVGAAGSVSDILRTDGLNHRVEVTGGIMEEDCGNILKQVFAKRR